MTKQQAFGYIYEKFGYQLTRAAKIFTGAIEISGAAQIDNAIREYVKNKVTTNTGDREDYSPYKLCCTTYNWLSYNLEEAIILIGVRAIKRILAAEEAELTQNETHPNITIEIKEDIVALSIIKELLEKQELYFSLDQAPTVKARYLGASMLLALGCAIEIIFAPGLILTVALVAAAECAGYALSNTPRQSPAFNLLDVTYGAYLAFNEFEKLQQPAITLCQFGPLSLNFTIPRTILESPEKTHIADNYQLQTSRA